MDRTHRILGVSLSLTLSLAASVVAARGHLVAEDPRQMRVEKAGARHTGREVVVRSGAWRGQKGEQGRWRGRLERDLGRGTLAGEVSVDGSRLLSSALLEARIRGKSVRGVLKDSGGHWVIRLTGEVAGDAMSGTYEARDGGRGTWSSP